MQTNARMAPQRVFQCTVQFPGAFRGRHDVRVVQEGEDLSESGSGLAQSRMLRERVERWHQRVTLFSSFALYHLMFAAVVVEPGVRAGAAVKLAGEREEWDKGRAGPEPLQHCLARYMVVGADRIDGQHGRAWVQLGSSVEELVQALGACPRAQPKLVRTAASGYLPLAVTVPCFLAGQLAHVLDALVALPLEGVNGYSLPGISPFACR